MLLQDFVFALRMLRKAPGFTAAALFRDRAWHRRQHRDLHRRDRGAAGVARRTPSPHRVVAVHGASSRSSARGYRPRTSWTTARRAARSAIGAYQRLDDDAERGTAAERLGAGCDRGRSLRGPRRLPLSAAASSERRARVDHRRGARPRDVAAALRADPASSAGRSRSRAATQVIGVMPRGLTFPGDVDLWVPLVLTAAYDPRAARSSLRERRRAARARRVARAGDADLSAIEQSIADSSRTVQGYGVSVRPLLDAMVGDVSRPMLILLGAVGFVLLIACVNVSNLLLARGRRRRGDRGALRPWRRPLAHGPAASGRECGALAGGRRGGRPARDLGSARARERSATDLPRSASVDGNGLILLFSIVVSATPGIVFGIAPAIVASRLTSRRPSRTSRRDGRSAGGRGAFRRVLVAAQVALALVLLAGAGLAMRSFERLNRVDPGFHPDGVLTFPISLPEATYPDDAASHASTRPTSTDSRCTRGHFRRRP